jgi:hypothetical protein
LGNAVCPGMMATVIRPALDWLQRHHPGVSIAAIDFFGGFGGTF